ncbi:hypothetical protein O181_030817 [Austropuccinia psidii MF-1]|uniref:Integrase catalytic domain-containing protein n=1 Tax=Austropuccinia psidii MF-1 TaxID=1389203 RepID=A0A9Q3CZE7_9BASI|nr:hypothetical protein [Austropuccinia psidii MF-1]
MDNNTETDHKRPLPILTENNFPEWRRRIISLLRQKKLYVHCIEATIPSLSSETRPSAADNKIIDANIKTCNIITNSLDSSTFSEIVVGDEEMENAYLLWSKITNRFASSTFNSQARIWSRFSKITYNRNLRSFISELRQSLNEIRTVGIEVGIKTLAFAILTKLPDDFNSLIEKITLNTETQGSPDAILNLLHDAALKEEALKTSIESNIDSKMALNRETFKSKTIHYCSNGLHNPLASHPPEKCWQLHPEKRPDRYQRDTKTNYTFARALLTTDKTSKRSDVLNVALDTGASDHMFDDRSFFSSLDKIKNSTISTGCDSSSLTAIGKGTAKLIDRNGVCWTLKNSLYVPKLNTNLVALSQLASQVIIKSTGENVNVFLDEATTPSFQCPSKTKVLETKVKLGIKCLSTRNRLWHQRLGHLNEKATKTLIPTYKAAGEVCDECVKGKLTGIPFSHSFQSTSHVLEVVHMDLCGPMHTQSLSGTRYFLILIDQFTGYTTTKFLKQKEETLAAFKEYKTWAENFHQRKILKIVSDGGGEFVNGCFKRFAITEGFEHSISPPYTPQHNGIAERGNRSVLEGARCLMQQTKLTDQFWAEAMSTATFLLNMAPKRDGISPYEKWFNRKPPVSNLRTFGCRAWLRIPPVKRRSKFESIAWEGIMLGYENHASAYRILILQDRRVVISRHVKFDETYFPNLIPPLNTTKTLNPIPPISANSLNSHKECNDMIADVDDSCSEWEDEFHDTVEEMPQRRIRVIGPRHPTLITGDVSEENILPYRRRAHQTVETSIVPRNYQQAVDSKDSNKWKNAIVKELNNMEKLDVWTIRDKTPKDHPITCTWVFKLKGTIRSKPNQLIASTNLKCRSQQSSIPPNGCEKCISQCSSELKYLSCGTRRNRPTKRKDPATQQGDIRLEAGTSGVVQSPGEMASLSRFRMFSEEIQGKFDMKDLEHYIKNIAENYNITELAPTKTPLKPGLQLTKASEVEIDAFQKMGLNYRSIIGALNYISTNTRPDITFAISHLSQFLEQPSIKHWEASLQVLRYLYHTKEKTLNYHNKGKCNIISYADADWGNSLIDRRSVGGYTLFLNHHLISWRTKKQQTISHSTTEAEYKSLSDASKEILWFQQLLREINLEIPSSIPTLYNDNKGAIDLAHSNINHNGFKTKHMDIKFHFIRDLIKNQKLELFYVSTHLMAADFLTKAVGKTILLRSKSFINLY